MSQQALQMLLQSLQQQQQQQQQLEVAPVHARHSSVKPAVP
jgi:hypothetical protein